MTQVLISALRCPMRAALCVMLLVLAAGAASKVHVISFGSWTSVQWNPGTGADHEKALTIKVRPLLVDGRVKEYVLGAQHEVTERLFVVRRAFRINDSLAGDSGAHWLWQRGGWLLVDRLTGRILSLPLPEFDPLYSLASWYRDYVAYCGVSDDGKKIFAIVAQIGRRKPMLKKPLSNDGVQDESVPDSACPAPIWKRSPTRVAFEPPGGMKQSFAIRGQMVDVVNDADEDDEEGSK